LPENLITGTFAGTHAIAPAGYLSSNFEISYGLGTLTILPRSLNITADNKTATYGQSITFTSSVSGLQYGETLNQIASGNVTYSVLNGATAVAPIYPAGNFNIVPSGISLNAPADYVLSYNNGSLQVDPAALTVQADLKFINRNDPLPAFTSTITGFVAGGQNTVVSGPTYSVSPSGCCTQAGQYAITPSNLVLAVPGNYNINYISGPLYVNPKGQGAKKINVSLVCVDTVSNHPSGFPFLARFQWENQNNTPVYVPLGTTNYFNATGQYVGNPPTLFTANTIGVYEIPFDGQSIQWICISYNGNQQVTATSNSGTSTSNKCAAHLSRTTLEQSQIPDLFSVFPNPAIDELTIQSKFEELNITRISVFDASGRSISLPDTNFESPVESAKINIATLNPGIYAISIETAGNRFVVRFVKLL